MTAEKIMDCPFCGNVPTLRHIGGSRPFVLLSCKTDNCPATPKVTGDTEAEVIEGWNTRSSAVGAGAREASRLLNKIVDLADDENAVDPLDDAIEYAKKALAILQPSDPVRRTTQQGGDK